MAQEGEIGIPVSLLNPEVEGKDQKKVFIVANRVSRRGTPRFAELLDWLRTRKIDARAVHSKYPGHVEELVGEIIKNYENPTIVVVGGDGTYSQAINGALKASEDRPVKAIFAFLPAGTADDNARSLGQDQKGIREALLRKPEVRTVDALKMIITTPSGEQELHYGLGYVVFGFSAQGAKKIAERRTPERSLSTAEQFLATLELASAKPIEIEIGGRRERLSEIIIVNSTKFAKFFKFKTDMADGKFDTVFLTDKIIPLTLEAVKSTVIPHEGYRRSELKFKALSNVIPQIDGEVIQGLNPESPEITTGSTVSLSVEKGAIPVLKI
ncbi:MAG: hypothetical protein A2152_01975 [Candidatus Levybacteria bacterium RBG_16_35_6]|nr:MAG: hypothetical protein A2152_01975 [Candidatus Levybacteria bacterium RBG_16_35_6]